MIRPTALLLLLVGALAAPSSGQASQDVTIEGTVSIGIEVLRFQLVDASLGSPDTLAPCGTEVPSTPTALCSGTHVLGLGDTAATVAADLAAEITNTCGVFSFTATSSGNVLTIFEPPGAGLTAWELRIFGEFESEGYYSTRPGCFVHNVGNGVFSDAGGLSYTSGLRFLGGDCNASATTLGSPCGGATMSVSPPVLGTTGTLTVNGTVPSVGGTIFISPNPGGSFFFQGCEIFLLQLVPFASFVTNGVGDATVSGPVPPDPALCGQEQVFQALVLSGIGPVTALGVEVTNGVLVTLGI